MYIYKNGSITKKVFFVFDEAKSQEKANSLITYGLWLNLGRSFGKLAHFCEFFD